MKKQILIVDDEPNIVLSLEFLMRKNNFDVLIGRNGKEAQSILAQDVPDLVILDIMMPDVDGYQICQEMRSDDKFNDTKIIFLSAKSNTAEIEKGLNMGADLYITKPFSTRRLVSDIKSLLE